MFITTSNEVRINVDHIMVYEPTMIQTDPTPKHPNKYETPGSFILLSSGTSFRVYETPKELDAIISSVKTPLSMLPTAPADEVLEHDA